MAHALIVDDDPEIREMLCSALEAEGHVVLEATDGVSALERLRDSNYPLIVLLDLGMPRLDGAGVLEAVAGDRALAQRHRFLLVTANPLPLPPRLDALLASLDVPLLSKPLDLTTLLDSVAHLAHATHRTVGTPRTPHAQSTRASVLPSPPSPPSHPRLQSARPKAS